MRAVNFKSAQIIAYAIPLFVILFSIVLALSPTIQAHPELATAITYDLTLTAPILFLLLSGKSTISKLKAVPFFIGGTLIASYVLPENSHQHLDYIITYAVPVVELIVFAIIARKLFSGIKRYTANAAHTADFYTVSKKSTQELFGKTSYASFFASEIAMLYYVFFAWKRIKLQPNEFTNYKENASMAIAGALLMVVCIETYAFHVLLLKWSSLAAWILTATSIYTAFMIIGHIKALRRRPSVLTHNELVLKNGLLADCTINLEAIYKIELCTAEMASRDLKIKNLSLSKESTHHNIAIHFSTPQTIEKIYGFSDECDVLLLHMDDKHDFVEKVNLRLQGNRD